MLGGWSKPKFYTKCKSLVRQTRIRLEHVKKKRIAVEKFLKTDIADLLRGGFHYNAYLKADTLVMEQNVSACYDFVEQFCGCISDHLSDMAKQKECPEECQEAAGSLVYAAARFADLPELRQLRSLFTARYGTNLDSFANKEFVDKFKAKPGWKDTRIELMQQVAQEFSIDWDSKCLEQKLFTPPNETNKDSYDVAEENEVVIRDCRSEHDDSQTQTISSSDDAESKRPFYYRFIRPPYTRTRSRTRATTEEARESEQSSDETKARSVTKKGDGDGDGDGEQRIVDRFVRYCSKKWSENGESRRRHRTTKSQSSLGGHANAIVHPNLPDYDQLPARVAALTGIYQT